MHDTRALTSQLADLLRREHFALADFLVALAEFDRERRWSELGYTSLFYFLHRELKLSKGAAFYRKIAAELIQHHPEIVEPLRDGRLCITSVVELAKVITPENRHHVVARFFHASKDEARAVVAELRPTERPSQRDVVTVCANAAQPEAHVVANNGARAQLVHPANHPLEGNVGSPPFQPTATAEAARRVHDRSAMAPTDEAEPLTADLRRLHVTVSRRFLDKLAAARDALSHSHPGATTETILETALDLVLERDAKRKALVKKPRPSTARASGAARHVPAAVKRAVWQRDGGRCQWPLAAGGTCGSTTRLQLDHVIPLARGGASTADNLRLTCAFHNQLAARQVFGDAWMDAAVRSARGRGPAGAQAQPPG